MRGCNNFGVKKCRPLLHIFKTVFAFTHKNNIIFDSRQYAELVSKFLKLLFWNFFTFLKIIFDDKVAGALFIFVIFLIFFSSRLYEIFDKKSNPRIMIILPFLPLFGPRCSLFLTVSLLCAYISLWCICLSPNAPFSLFLELVCFSYTFLSWQNARGILWFNCSSSALQKKKNSYGTGKTPATWVTKTVL